MNKHTPAPWREQHDYIVSGDSAIVASIWRTVKIPEEEREANLQLLLAAPKMLAALQAVSQLDTYLHEHSYLANLVREAIEEATK